MKLSEIHIRYILEDVLLGHANGNISVNNVAEGIVIQNGSYSYTEASFYFSNPQLTAFEIEQLNEIAQQLVKNHFSIDETIALTEKLNGSYFKIIHFFINEYYLDRFTPKDQHGRVDASAVNLIYLPILQAPIVDILRLSVFNKLNIQDNSKIKLVLTCDYDILNIWHAKGIFGSFKRLMKWWVKYFKPTTFLKDLYSLVFSSKWMNANYMLTNEMLSTSLDTKGKYNIQKIAFFLINSTHKYDFDNRFDNKAIQDFIQKLKSDNTEFGLHPSYETLDKKELLSFQTQKFLDLFGKQVALIRFHYLRCLYPETLTLLEILNIKEDHSFYFAEDAFLFRAGTTRPFKMWNEQENRSYSVQIVPITLMDGSLDMYMKLDYKDALALCKKKITMAKTYGNHISLLWHNSELYFGKTDPTNYQYRLFKEIERYLSELE